MTRLERLLVTCTVNPLPPVQLAFEWTTNQQVPLILGQVNFFTEFDVCFLRSNNVIEVRPQHNA